MSVFIARLVINRTAQAKLAARGITPDEAEQVVANGVYVVANPKPRVPGSRLMVGATDGGRVLTFPIQPDLGDEATWHVMTGWPSAQREIAVFRRYARS